MPWAWVIHQRKDSSVKLIVTGGSVRNRKETDTREPTRDETPAPSPISATTSRQRDRVVENPVRPSSQAARSASTVPPLPVPSAATKAPASRPSRVRRVMQPSATKIQGQARDPANMM